MRNYNKIFILMTLAIFANVADAGVNIRFMIVSDMHYGSDNGIFTTVRGAPQHYTDIVNWANNEKNSKGLDYLFINGDLDDKGWYINPTFYTAIKGYLANLTVPYYVTNGNHDNFSSTNFSATWNQPIDYTFTSGNYVFILLNSPWKISVNTTYLDQQLSKYNNKTAFLIFHIAQRKFTFIDTDSPNFRTVLAKHNNIAGIFVGHDHVVDRCFFRDNVWQCYDGHGGAAATYYDGYKYYGYRIVEGYDNGTILSYEYDGTANEIINTNVLVPKPRALLRGYNGSINVSGTLSNNQLDLGFYLPVFDVNSEAVNLSNVSANDTVNITAYSVTCSDPFTCFKSPVSNKWNNGSILNIPFKNYRDEPKNKINFTEPDNSTVNRNATYTTNYFEDIYINSESIATDNNGNSYYVVNLTHQPLTTGVMTSGWINFTANSSILNGTVAIGNPVVMTNNPNYTLINNYPTFNINTGSIMGDCGTCMVSILGMGYNYTLLGGANSYSYNISVPVTNGNMAR